MDSFSGIKIKNLGENNFHTWKQKVELPLALKDLFHHLIAPATTDEKELSKWTKHDAKARAITECTLSDKHIDHIRNVITAAYIWNSIRDFF